MKVFIVPSWYTTLDSPNSGVFFKEQARALKEIGLEVVVAYPEITSLRYIKRRVKTGLIKQHESGVLTYRFTGYHFFPKIKHATRIIFYLRLKKIFNNYVQTYGKPDIIHAHSVRWGGWAAAKLADKYNIPLVITEHSSAYGRNLIEKKDIPLIRESLKVAKKVIVVGPNLKQEMKKYTREDKIILIPNIVDISKFKPTENHIKYKERFRFLSVAFLTANKGMDILIKAFAKSFKGNNGIELIIGGNGEEKNNLEGLAIMEGVADQIIFMGELSREQVVEQMQKCDVFVLASKYETFGIVYIEALACGKPVLATRCGGPEIIVNKNNGLLVEVNDIDGLSNSMIHLYKNYEDYNSKSIASDCNNRFGKDNVSRQIINVYKEIVV